MKIPKPANRFGFGTLTAVRAAPGYFKLLASSLAQPVPEADGAVVAGGHHPGVYRVENRVSARTMI
jgi:hypothetical protein